MALVLYERLVQGDRRPSPYCWRARMALAHKGLEAEYRAIKYAEVDQIGFSGQGKVPVLVDGERVAFDSWAIACYLEDAYPDRPSLFGGARGRALARFINLWVDEGLQKAFGPILAPSLYDLVVPEDRDYYRTTREARWGLSFETLRSQRAERIKALHQAFAPLRGLLAEQPFICGATPAHGDYLVFGEFQWARCVDPEDLVPAEDRDIRAWRARMIALFDGLPNRVPAFASAA
ncbi:MAG: glutathione S-transferase N-terminal domain-containing protein [Kiloniellales bacterium]